MNRAPPPRPPPRTKAAARAIQAALKLSSEAVSAPDSSGVGTADAKLVFLPAGAGELLEMPRPGGFAEDGTGAGPSTASTPRAYTASTLRAQPQGAAESTRQEQARILDQIDKRIAERESSGSLSDRRGSRRRREPSKLVGDEELLAVAVQARAEEEAAEFHAIYMTPDIYSMAIFAGAGYCKSELAKLWILVIALACFVAQVGSLLLAIMDLQPDSSRICCTKLLGHPVNVHGTVRAGQWLAVIFSIFSLENIICIDTLAFINTIISRALYPGYQYEKQACVTRVA